MYLPVRAVPQCLFNNIASCSKKSLLHHWEPLPLSNTFSLTLQAVRVLPMGNNNINEMTINHIAMTDQHMQPKNTFLVMNFFINQVESTPNTVFN